MEHFCSSVGKSVMDSKTFTRHMSVLAAQNKLLKRNALSQSWETVRRAYETVDGKGINKHQLIYLAVSYDGT